MSNKQLIQEVIDCGWNCVIAKSGRNAYITVSRIEQNWEASFPKAIITIDNHYPNSRYQRKKQRGAVTNKHTFFYEKPNGWPRIEKLIQALSFTTE